MSWVRVPPEAARKSDCLGCAVLLCLVCLTLLASFFLPSHLSFKNMYMHVHCTFTMYMYMYVSVHTPIERTSRMYRTCIYFSKPLRLLYSLVIYEIVNFLSSLFTLCYILLSFFLYLKSVPIYVIVHVLLMVE